MANGLCPKCGAVKENQSKNAPYCNACARERRKLERAANPEKFRAMERAAYAAMSTEQKTVHVGRKVRYAKAWSPEKRAKINALATARRATWSEARRQQQKDTQKRNYDKRQLRPAMGLCAYTVSCTEPPIGEHKFCLRHWCRGLVNAEKGSKRTVPQYTEDDLMGLWNKQNGKCAISGAVLIPGKFVELDHIIPVVRGGDSSLGNVRFTHGVINRMKGDMLDHEFAPMLLSVIDGLKGWSEQIMREQDAILLLRMTA